MAKTSVKTPTDAEVIPAFGDAFAPPETGGTDVRTSPEIHSELERMRSENARLKAENESLKARSEPEPLAGKWYQVSLHNGPRALVQTRDGEHPFDAYKRRTGVIASQHAPEVSEVPEPTDKRERILKPGE